MKPYSSWNRSHVQIRAALDNILLNNRLSFTSFRGERRLTGRLASVLPLFTEGVEKLFPFFP